jgi:hypothetical protein
MTTELNVGAAVAMARKGYKARAVDHEAFT